MSRHFMYDQDRHDRQRAWGDARRARLATARAKGTHTRAEWVALVYVFRRCVICGVGIDDLHGGMPCKDHIISILAGGCDCIANIQPACRGCNTSKGQDQADYRPLILPDWSKAFVENLSLLANLGAE